MELRHLRYFVAVAEEMNFTRAAKKLRIHQPPLSSQIQQLEKELGTPLFRRLPKGVELTDAGKLLLEQARIILKQVEDAAIGVRRRGRGETGQIIVGSSGFYFHPVILKILSEIKARYPNLTIAPELDVSNIPLLIGWLRTGRIDLCLIPLPIDDSDGLEIEPLVDEDCVLALPRGHPLSNSVAVSLASLATERFVLCYRDSNLGMYDSILAACARAGFSPKVVQQAAQIVSAMPMVSAGFGVSIMPRAFSEIVFPGVSYVDIEGETVRSAIGLAYRCDDRSPAIKNAVKAARLAKVSA
jgi:DNA-binding transcriptional LysR family regulator